MKTVVGRTFSQIDGKQYGWELLKDTAKTGFRKLLKKGARKYFSTDKSRGEITDEELCEMLLLDISGSPGATVGQFPASFHTALLYAQGRYFRIPGLRDSSVCGRNPDVYC